MYVVAHPVHITAENITIHLVIQYYNMGWVKLQEKRLTTLVRQPFRIALEQREFWLEFWLTRAQKFFRSRFAGLVIMGLTSRVMPAILAYL